MIEYLEERNLTIVDGLRFRRDSKTGYFLSSKRLDGKRKRLHVYIWEKHNGEIPKGFEIHHKDHDKNNNDISNLEILSSKEHHERHTAEMTSEHREKLSRNLETTARPCANIWHGSPEGRNWHKQHYDAMKDKFYISAEFICQNCGNSFIGTYNGHNKFCSSNCKTAYRRKSGVDNIERECECCGEKFITNKYSQAKYCEKHRRKGSSGRRICGCV